METELLIAIVTSSTAAASGIACAWISSRNGKKAEKAAKDAQEYRRDREELDVAKWKVLKATMEGVTVLLHQARGEKLNGNVEDALDNIKEAEHSLDEVQTKLLAKMQS